MRYTYFTNICKSCSDCVPRVHSVRIIVFLSLRVFDFSRKWYIKQEEVRSNNNAFSRVHPGQFPYTHDSRTTLNIGLTIIYLQRSQSGKERRAEVATAAAACNPKNIIKFPLRRRRSQTWVSLVRAVATFSRSNLFSYAQTDTPGPGGPHVRGLAHGPVVFSIRSRRRRRR